MASRDDVSALVPGSAVLRIPELPPGRYELAVAGSEPTTAVEVVAGDEREATLECDPR